MKKLFWNAQEIFMQGLEIARNWYLNILLPALEKDFSTELPAIAIGLVGRGSECFGFDDDISCDHDFMPAPMLWINDESDRKFGFRLERAYRKLLKENPPANSCTQSSLLGDSEQNVHLINDFYQRHLGIPGVPENYQQWLYIPEYALAEATNGEVFRDDLQEFSQIRNNILHGMPEDVRLKKLAARAIAMAQSGQYNFIRCHKHGEPGAAGIALAEFVRNAVSMVFLLNRRFTPYYKWMFRAMRNLPRLSELTDILEILLTAQYQPEDQIVQIETVCSRIIAELTTQNLTSGKENYLEPHAFAIMQNIRDRQLRNMHIMEG